MSMTTGVAADNADFLERLQAFLTGAGHAFGLVRTTVGNGKLLGPTGVPGGYVGGATSVAETFTITFTAPTTFNVSGSVSGAIGTAAATGVAFDHAKVKFRIDAGTTAFVAGDVFKLSTSPPWALTRKRGIRSAVAGRVGTIASGLQNAFDSNNATYASGPVPATIGVHLIAPTVLGRIEVGSSSDPNFSPAAFTLQWSDEGITWTDLQSWSGQTWAVQQVRSFNVTAAHTAHARWRINVTAVVVPANSVFINTVGFFAGVNDDTPLDRRGEIVFTAPGSSGTDVIPVCAELYQDEAAGRHSLNFYGVRTFDPNKAVRNQANAVGPHNVPLASGAFTYWIFANGRRFVVVAKIGTVYIPCYQGFAKQYELPSAHPFPMVSAGTSNDEAGIHTSVAETFRGFPQPAVNSNHARYPDGVWRSHSSYDVNNTDRARVYPSAVEYNGTAMALRENLDGSRTLFELVMMKTASTSSQTKHMLGEFDGCYYVPGFNLTAETIITMDGFDHIAFQNCHRSGQNDFFAVRQD